MATLVHDDVIDDSKTRRGTDTVKQLWGNRLSINAGNFIFARSLALVAAYQRCDMIKILADTSTKICEGEIIQLLGAYNTRVGLKNYLRRIERKTAADSVSCQRNCLPPATTAKWRLSKIWLLSGHGLRVTDDILDWCLPEVLGNQPARYRAGHHPAGYIRPALRLSPDLHQWLSSRAVHKQNR